jgi:hypothetical protein
VPDAATNVAITIKWDAPTKDGNDAITEWKVYSDKGTDSSFSLLSSVSGINNREYKHTLPVSSGGSSTCYGLSTISSLEKAVFKSQNEMRTKPKSWISTLNIYLDNFDGNTLELPGETPLVT